jgi:undecaprenyl-diphosphatase
MLRLSFAARVFAGFLISSASLALVGALIRGPSAIWIETFDEAVRTGSQSLASPWLSAMLLVITRCGSTIVLTVVGVAASAAFIVLRWWRALGLFLLAMAGQIILHNVSKVLFDRERPQASFGYIVGDTFSFPSGHALASLCLYGILAWLFTNSIRSDSLKAVIWIFTTILILLIGFSRIYFGAHYASDVIAGYLSALIWTIAVASGDRHRTDELKAAR